MNGLRQSHGTPAKQQLRILNKFITSICHIPEAMACLAYSTYLICVMLVLNTRKGGGGKVYSLIVFTSAL